MLTRDEADQQLRAAIQAHADAYELGEPDEFLNEFGVIVHWQKIEDDGRSRYTTHFHRSSIPNHIAVGLFTVGAGLADGGYDED